MPRPSKYPWPKWTDGHEYAIFKDRDYAISTHNMQISLHARARYQGLRVETESVTKRASHQGVTRTFEGLRFRFYNV